MCNTHAMSRISPRTSVLEDRPGAFRRTIDERCWRPSIFDPGDPSHRAALRDLHESGRIWSLHDGLEYQTEAPKPDSRPHDSRWIYYPWSGRLVHLLAPDSYRAVRSSRNLYKITPCEQARLGRLTIAIAGLSAGAAVALTLALEGIGGHLKLADFDRLELCNMNRLRASVHDLGLPKTVLLARQLMELNPYLELTLYPRGVTRDCIDHFLGGDAPSDILVDECDTLSVKWLLRERARARRVPVIMETSDRGMLDVERFDLEPDRPILHGRLGDLTSRQLERLSPGARLGLAARIAGPEEISARLAASALEIGQTIDSWPQLGSDVALGGASATAAIRRIALGQPMSSGRRHVDLDAILSGDPSPASRPEPDARPGRDAGPGAMGTPALRQLTAPYPAIDGLSEDIHFIVHHAAMAPSGGNIQPWRFHATADRLWICVDAPRADKLLDVERRATHIALGAALENLTIAAACRGYGAEIRPFPDPFRRDIVVEIALESGPEPELASRAALIDLVRRRVTNRLPGTGESLCPMEIRRLRDAAQRSGADLDLVSGRPAIIECARVVGEAERIRYLVEPLHRELFGELRWSAGRAARSRDGIDLDTLELDPSQRARLRLAARPDVARLHRDFLGARAMAQGWTYELTASASALGMLRVKSDSPGSWLAAGRAVQRVWLEATGMGVGVQPVGVILHMLHMLAAPVSAIFRPDESSTLLACERRLEAGFPPSPRRVPVMMFRFVKAPTPPVRSRRRPVAEILAAGPPATLSRPGNQR